jgi:Tol biopolymer transport system component
MSPQPTWMRGPAGLALAAVMTLWACDGPQEPDRAPEAAASRPILAAAIISNPVTSPGSGTRAPVVSEVGQVVYVSLAPGAVPGGEEATLRNPRTGVLRTVVMVEGGFDPVAIEGSAGDTLELDIQVTGAEALLRYAVVAPERRPPVVVRTDPPPKKRDVPLNAVLLVVFSEPLDPGTLAGEAVQLFLDGAPLEGAVGFGDDAHLTVTFTPAAPLEPGAEYTLWVTTAIADRDGDALEATVTVSFATQTLLADLIVSDPVGDSPGSDVVYASLRPGVFTDGRLAVLRRRGTEPAMTAALVDGGLDPVPVAAGPGDTIDVRIEFASALGTWARAFLAVVPANSPPVVVRTDPAQGERGVAQDAVPLVVFSEPLDPATLTGESAQLFVGGAMVEGAVAFGDGAHLTVTVTPTTPLEAGARYTLVVTQALADRDGDALEATLAMPFTTRAVITGEAGIYLAAADGSGASWLVRGSRPAWSPDGTRIAFHREGGIHVIDTDRSNERLVTPGTDPAWSPDGQSILFADGNGISVITLADSAIVSLIGPDFLESGEPPQGLGKPAWSPDGARIAFERYGTERTPVQIYVMNADGSAPRRLTDADALAPQCAESDPSWSADGAWVAYWSYCSGISLAARNGALNSVYADLSTFVYGARPSVSPDGETLLASSPGWQGDPDLFVMARDGTGLRVLVSGGYHGAWSPDGRRIAFVHGLP